MWYTCVCVCLLSGLFIPPVTKLGLEKFEWKLYFLSNFWSDWFLNFAYLIKYINKSIHVHNACSGCGMYWNKLTVVFPDFAKSLTSGSFL